MSYRSGGPYPGKTLLSLERAREGVRYLVALIARPESMNDRRWQGAVLRLEELGMFAGETVEKTGTLGPLGAIVVRVGGSRVAVSREIARSVLLRAVGPAVPSLSLGRPGAKMVPS